MKLEQSSEKSTRRSAELVKNPREVAQMLGDDVELAYGKVLHEFGRIQGGVGDGGKDFVSLSPNEYPDFQIKSSWAGAKKFFVESIKRNEFIPIAIGEPGTVQEIFDSIKKYGGWVGKDEPLREEYLHKIQSVRHTIESGKNSRR